METRYLTPALLPRADSWRLLDWCVARGADEFTLRVMCVRGEDAPLADAFEDAFAPYALGAARRRVLSTPAEGAARDVVRLWRLDAASAALLPRFLPEGLFTQRVDDHGWFEDPLVYRGGEPMLGVVTHEREGVLRVSAGERRELEAMGIRTRAEGTWVDL